MLCDNELSLLENCLRVNPKAYGVWLHREWVMNCSPIPDWKHEKKLCDLFLKYDERNCKTCSNNVYRTCEYYLRSIYTLTNMNIPVRNSLARGRIGK